MIAPFGKSRCCAPLARFISEHGTNDTSVSSARNLLNPNAATPLHQRISPATSPNTSSTNSPAASPTQTQQKYSQSSKTPGAISRTNPSATVRRPNCSALNWNNALTSALAKALRAKADGANPALPQGQPHASDERNDNRPTHQPRPSMSLFPARRAQNPRRRLCPSRVCRLFDFREPHATVTTYY